MAPVSDLDISILPALPAFLQKRYGSGSPAAEQLAKTIALLVQAMVLIHSQ